MVCKNANIVILDINGTVAVKELKDTFFYSTDNPPEREYEPYLRN